MTLSYSSASPKRDVLMISSSQDKPCEACFVLYSSFSDKDHPVPFLLLPILLILDRRPAAGAALCGGCHVIGTVEGPEGCISSRSRPDQSAGSIGVMAVAHRRPAAVRTVV